MSASRLSLCAGLLIFSACGVDDEPLVATEQEALLCPELVCGNAKLLFGPFYELDMTMKTPSALGSYRITSFKKDDIDFNLEVDGFKVKGHPKGGGPTYVNETLEGAVFVVEQTSTGKRVQMTIEDVGSIPYYEGGHVEGVKLPTFKLIFQELSAPGKPVGPKRPVCPAGSNLYFDRHALLFSDNRYLISGGVSESGDDESHPWFNIACNDTGLWKAALFRLVSAAETDAFPSETKDYSAAVRSIRADYCGNGIAHTALGTMVDWENRGGWLTKTDGLLLEAVWGEDGAICLNKPRLADVHPDELECTIPRCTRSQEENWKANGDLMATWVPAIVAVPPAPPVILP